MAPAATEPNLRAEVFGVERLEAHAQSLAASHLLATRVWGAPALFRRLQDNRRALRQAQQIFARAVEQKRPLAPSAEWLLDNFYLVQSQLQQIEQDLPRSYYQELPKLAEGPYPGYPRVYALALELIAHTDSHLDLEVITRFVRAYQVVQPLRSGELWAVPIMLRLGLIENLRQLMEGTRTTQQTRSEADEWADQLLALSSEAPGQVRPALVRLAQRSSRLEPIFAVQLLERLRDQAPSMAPALQWVEQALAEQGTHLSALIRAEHQRRAANRVSVGNVITSLRTLITIDWADFFETTSLVEKLLRQDPADIYPQMDFETRDRYRHVLERLSKGTKLSELEVARRVLRQAQRAAPPPDDPRQAHIGYYLIDRGRAMLETELGYRPTWLEGIGRWARQHPTTLYLGAVTLLTAIFGLTYLSYAAASGLGPLGWVGLALLVAVPASVLAISTINWTISVYVHPEVVPKLEFKAESPEDQRTMVVVPCLINSQSGIQHLFDKLEIRYLANRDPQLHFALLGDFADAPAAQQPEDEALLETAVRLVRQLNERYPNGRTAEGTRFYFFHRRRCWNASEGVWMGWERKRGKLVEFNRLLRGATDTNYTVQLGDLSILPEIKYVITLDADTELPLNSAKRLIGAMAHPLNRPRLDPVTRCVTQGYGIIQPRTAVTALSASQSRFARIFADDTGLDPYARAVSMVYQDLFGAGSYIGKAIYDVDVLNTALAGRFPENLLLSHDLLEGAYVRAGVATDIQLLEDFPSGYDAFIQRQHRWIRGDWQITDWVVGRPVDAAGRRAPNPLPLIERWKMFDNLRSSLIAPTTMLLLLLGWTVLPGSPVIWTLAALLSIFLPQLILLVLRSGVHPPGETWRVYFREVGAEALLKGLRASLFIIFLLFESLVNVDAILRVMVRRFITRRRLLQWNTAAFVEHGQARSLSAHWARMWPVTVVALALWLLIGWARPEVLGLASFFMILWGGAPFIAYLLSQRGEARSGPPLPETARRELRLVARRIWNFYETFASHDDHWLPPDNVQQEPSPRIAHRTSPTNIGLLILSTLAAYDFGYIGVRQLAERLENLLTTLDNLERHRGHFLNWYDTRTLQPLYPAYVSTVDSGNLAASLMLLKQACLEIAHAPVFRSIAEARTGLDDTVAALQAALQRVGTPAPTAPQSLEHLTKTVAAVAASLAQAKPGRTGWVELLNELATRTLLLRQQVQVLDEAIGQAEPSEVKLWSERLLSQVRACRSDVRSLLPWTLIPPASLLTFSEDEALVEQVQTLINLLLGRSEWPSLHALANAQPATAELARLKQYLQAATLDPDEQREITHWLVEMEQALQRSAEAANHLVGRYHSLAAHAETLFAAMDFRFLFNEDREIFSIGYNLVTKRLDQSYYDLFASEARLASFIAIALGQIPAQHWFKLSRPMSWTGGSLTLLSWGGTLFEYLMPTLWMRDYEQTLLYQTHRAAIRSQMHYGARRHVPWGISESGFYAFDYQLNYQYQSFGVPDLGLKRNLAKDLVVAPYATFLALPFFPRAAWDNLQRLAREGLSPPDGYGFYEAIDYSANRHPKGQRAGLVRSYMAHHQGMSLAALDNYLNDFPMQRRFHAELSVAATELLLQEKLPRHVPLAEAQREAPPLSGPAADDLSLAESHVRHFRTPHTLTPRTHLLSNGSYQVMVTNAGGGYSAYDDPSLGEGQVLAVTRWRDDLTRDQWGSFIYIKDVANQQAWSAAYQPLAREPETYEVIYAPEKARIRRRDAGIETELEIALPPQDNAEMRRLSLTNHSPRARTLEITSYAEVVLDRLGADLAHPAFSKLFVESEFVPDRQALLFKRRSRSPEQAELWAVHLVTSDETFVSTVECETDRAKFLGRGRTPANPLALDQPLSGTTGAVLDPIMSLRCRVRLEPGETLRLTFITGVAASREGAMSLADRYYDARAIESAFELAWVYTQIQFRHLSITTGEAHLFQRLASRVIYPDPGLRATAEVLSQNVKGQAGLWPYGISGDYPMVLVRVANDTELELIHQVLRAHEFWRLNDFSVDLVILNEQATNYADALQQQIQALIDSSLSRPWLDKAGGIFLRRADHMPPEDRVLLQAVARVVLEGAGGGLADQLKHAPQPTARTDRRVRKLPEKTRKPWPAPAPRPAARSLQFYNGLGGFSSDGREYVIHLQADQWTPAPWINVLANPRFGCCVSESGLGYTWSENSQANRLTPWSNDPVSDPPGEALYLYDEETGQAWSPTPLPIRTADPYVIRHGAGYTIFEHTHQGLAHELLVFVPVADPVKVMRLTLRNNSQQVRHLAVTGYAEWVLGGTRAQSQHFVTTEHDPSTGALLARNSYNTAFSQRLAFALCQVPSALTAAPSAARERPANGIDRRAAKSFTANRTEFLGRNGTLLHPAALEAGQLSGEAGACLDPCAALQTRFTLSPGQTLDVIFLLGQGQDREEVRGLIRRYADVTHVAAALADVTRQWDEVLGTLQVTTPDPALNLLLNRWLLYQALACRVWARSAFYQSGGAYGFRDQLQDVMALVWTRPDLAREHLLRAAARQFAEGDVQHWWHPPDGPGVRTRFSDDYLWLPYVTQHYVSATGDTGVLETEVPFLDAPPLTPEQHEVFMPEAASGAAASLYEHCRRALAFGLKFGQHGLPLMGIGDWNDGMNRVGHAGQGESVWLGWFLYTNLQAFADLAQARGETEQAAEYRQQAQQLQQALDEAGWDGAWYRRAYFDDGTPLGSAQNEECQIDAIAQAWAVISGAASPERAQMAMEAVENYLIKEPEGLILLLSPPFETALPHPGYIRGYVPGIRENGGQYTHAALWVIQAYVQLGQGDRAAELLRLINPIWHGETPEHIERYKVEPYVIAADVYAHPLHVGRGGWTWYTGSAAWMYRVALEGLLGLRRRGQAFTLSPCLPADWPGFQLTYTHGATRYEIAVENPEHVSHGVVQIVVDGQRQTTPLIPLVDDGRRHLVQVTLGSAVNARLRV